jgi:ABC-type antimicrobial peptide transport system permease subunit
MFLNYLTIAFRNFWKNKLFSFVNLSGLALGMAVSLAIGLWLWDELSFDRVHALRDRVVQPLATQTLNGHTGTNEAISLAFGAYIRRHYPNDIDLFSFSSWNSGHILSVGEKRLPDLGRWVEPDFPILFSLEAEEGSFQSLQDPSAIVISKKMANQLFGNGSALGNTIRIDNQFDLKVGAVFKDLPSNSSLHSTQYLMPWKRYLSQEPWVKESLGEWANHAFLGYFALREGVSVEDFQQKIRHLPKKFLNFGEEEIFLHRLKDWHLYDRFENGVPAGGAITFVWMFGTIGFFVLLLACINFMNLSTARSEKRSREVGIRKAIGSSRKQLVVQFLMESVALSFLALLLALALLKLALPQFNALAAKQMHIPFEEPWFWVAVLGLTLLTGLLAGSYPALFLSGFDTVRVLKGTFRIGKWALVPRKVLVVVQFTVSITLITGTWMVFQQIQFARNQPLGYENAGLVTLDLATPEIQGKYNLLRQRLLATGAADEVSESLSPVTDVWSHQVGFEWEGMAPGSKPLFGIVTVTHDYGNTVRWKIQDGRDFSRNLASDSSGIVLNEAALKLIGKKDALGMTILWNKKPYKVIGVVQNMVMERPYIQVQPTVFVLDYSWLNVLNIRLNKTLPVQDALARLEKELKDFAPSNPVVFRFSDADYQAKFDAEVRIGNLSRIFAGLAIFISFLGLFGLASFVAGQRTREIGVRKVLGAGLSHLWLMLSKDFMVLVLVACVFSVPIAALILRDWLTSFEIRTPMHWWIFGISGLGAMVLALVTVSFQTLRAAQANPVKSLRTE